METVLFTDHDLWRHNDYRHRAYVLGFGIGNNASHALGH
jgi:hypothetical protein